MWEAEMVLNEGGLALMLLTCSSENWRNANLSSEYLAVGTKDEKRAAVRLLAQAKP
jgi:hypothetical protein